MNFGNGALLVTPLESSCTLLSVGEIGRASFPARQNGNVIMGGVGRGPSCPDSRWCGWRTDRLATAGKTFPEYSQDSNLESLRTGTTPLEYVPREKATGKENLTIHRPNEQ